MEQTIPDDSSSTKSDTMAAVDPAFRIIPKGSCCFYIWRIEKMQVVPLPRDQYGKFFRGDSYIILSANEPGQPSGVACKTKEARGVLEMHIHFWLGSQTSQDEAGVAAYKTVELDDLLGGTPVQHREVESKESKRFLSYFRSGFRVLEGGIASGFTHVTDEFNPSLYIIKGKRSPIIRQLPQISWSQMNDGDVFILDTKVAIFVWTGKNANNMEKIQGAKFSQTLKNEHGGGEIIIVDDGLEQTMPKSERDLFNKHLPMADKKVKPASEVTPDLSQERRVAQEIKLYRCSDEDGTLKVTEVKNGPLYQNDLISEDSFIIDNGEQGIWVWVGKKASHKERAEAMRNAQGFIKKKGYPSYTNVTRVIDGGESSEFKSLFRSWRDRNQQVGLGRQNSASKIAKTVQTKFDAMTLHENRALAAQTQMVDDGSGKKEVWRVENFELVPVEAKNYGKFYGGDCYVILYTYGTGGTENYLIYYWMGSHSSQDEQGTAALKTVELDDKLGGRPVQVRIVQGKEPPHFMAIFGGRMIVYSGGKASKFDGVDSQGKDHGETYLLQVRGTSQYNSKAIQVECRAASLNSNDVFVLMSSKCVFVWCGKGSTGDEREMAKNIASTSSVESTTVYEGQEKADFWEAIGGEEAYSSDKRLMDTGDAPPPRLFQCSNASGRFKVEEIVEFVQSDLVQDDVMLLDAWDALFLWIGNQSNHQERQLSEKTAIEYLKTDPAGRDPNTPIIRIKQSYEPPNFTGFFGVWDRAMWNNNKTYDELRKELQAANPGMTMVVSQTNGNNTGSGTKYPLEILLEKDPENLPEGIDPTRKEDYLAPHDFEMMFKMNQEEFEALPKWKKQNLKKSTGLF